MAPDEGDENSVRIRRILVALDASAGSRAALQAAAELAVALEAELHGLFVEDVNLLRIGGSSLGREVALFREEPRQLESRELERQLRSQARRMRRALRQVAERGRVEWTFRTVRGQVATEVLAASAEVDLVTVGATGRSYRRPPGSTVRALLERGSGSVMVLRRGARLGPVIHVLHDGSDPGRRALAAAAGIARRAAGGLSVLLLESEDEVARRVREETVDWLREREVAARFHRLAGPGAFRLASVLESEGCGLLVASRGSFPDRPRALRRLLRGVSCPVLILR